MENLHLCHGKEMIRTSKCYNTIFSKYLTLPIATFPIPTLTENANKEKREQSKQDYYFDPLLFFAKLTYLYIKFF
jgi:hypothetical protein